MGNKENRKKEILTLAVCIALLPPLWAVFSSFIGITTGSVALICAGIFVADGSRYGNAPKIALGFLAGDVWAVLALKLMDMLLLPPAAELFLTLFFMGGAAVLISSALPGLLYLPSWLSGWAIGLTVMAPEGIANAGSLPVQIAISMAVGVFYVGIGVDALQKLLMKTVSRRDGSASQQK